MSMLPSAYTLSRCCVVWTKNSSVNIRAFEHYVQLLLCMWVPSDQHLIAALVADVEAAAHFDHWQRAHLDDQNVRQDLWPEALRNARVIPAVEYIQVWAVALRLSVSCAVVLLCSENSVE